MLSRTATSLAQFPLTAATAGANFVLGLVQAITSGQGPVADAVKNLAKSAIGAITGAFQTRSPSRVTARIGGYFTQGLAGGIDDGTDDVQDAAQGAGDAAIGGVGRGMKKAGGKGSGKGGRGMLAESITINFCGSASEFDEFREKAEKWREELGASGPEPEPA